MARQNTKKFRRNLLLAGVLLSLAIAGLISRPFFHLARTAWNDRNDMVMTPEGTADDASRMNRTNVALTWKIPANGAEAQLAALLDYARTNHLKVSIAGARHSMGGHTIYPGGVVVDMLPFNGMSLDETNLLLHVQAGARWHDILRFLNQRGFSVKVMQSNDDFSVGGSLSVNCHGWQYHTPPIDSTVESFRLMLADGSVVRCSRTENAELFSLVLGGYGLFGIILDVDLHIVPNERYRVERIDVAAADYVKVLEQKTGGDDVAMVYGRLRVTSERFLQDAIINVFHRLPQTAPVVSELGPVRNAGLQRVIFRGGAGDEYGKQLRWDAEKHFASVLSGSVYDRNDILYEPAAWFSDHSTNTSDILVECFVSRDRFEPFLAELRRIIPQNHGDLLNVTVRDVERDDDSLLHYAEGNRLSLVMLFTQARTAEGEAAMIKLTQEIVAATLRNDGRYYLPYRLHATASQFNQAYPEAKRFFKLKEKYDPDALFQNEFYLKYGR